MRRFVVWVVVALAVAALLWLGGGVVVQWVKSLHG
jgi:hypothetical protein